MARIPVRAILWRLMNQATFDSLNGHSPGQYDIRLTIPEGIEKFFEGCEQTLPTDLGGLTLRVPLQPFEGELPVAEADVRVRFMGPKSERKDWYLASQRPDTAYPLWRPGRGAPTTFAGGDRHFVLLIRDSQGNFHARWVSPASYPRLPEQVQAALMRKDVGVVFFEEGIVGR